MGGAVKKPLEKAFDMGFRAFFKGVMESPYKRTSVLHKEWQRGFDTAYLQNMKERTA